MVKKSKSLEEETETGKPEIEPEEKEDLGKEGGAEETPQGPGKSEVNYRKKFSESTTENQILQAKLKAAEEKLGKITSAEIPAEQELKNLYLDWEIMSEPERKLAEKNLILERRLKKVEQDFGGMKSPSPALRGWGESQIPEKESSVLVSENKFETEYTAARIKPSQTFTLILPNLIHKSKKRNLKKR